MVGAEGDGRVQCEALDTSRCLREVRWVVAAVLVFFGGVGELRSETVLKNYQNSSSLQRTDVPNYVLRGGIVQKLGRLQLEGFADFRRLACVSREYYQLWLNADASRAHAYPTSAQCWQPDYLLKLRATGRCKEVIAFLASAPAREFPLAICEFELRRDKLVWMALDDVLVSNVPRDM